MRTTRQTSLLAVLPTIALLLFVPPLQAGTNAFMESLNVQVVAKDGYYRGPFEGQYHGPEFGNNRIFLSYMTNDLTSAPGPHDIMAKMYDYETGSWTTSKIAAVRNTGNDGHNGPSVYLTSDGYIEVFYGSIDCGYSGFNPLTIDPRGGPCYKRSTKPYDMSAWGPELRIPCPGGINQTIGGFTPDGSLHIFGDLIYYRRAPDGSWKGYNSFIQNPLGNAVAVPRAGQDAKIVGNTIHFVWSSCARDLYHIMSVDNGITWRNAAGTASFASANGLKAVSTDAAGCPVFPSAYQVRSGFVGGNLELAIFKNGRIAILDSPDGQQVVLRTWNGTLWEAKTIDGGMTPLHMNMEVLSTGEVVVHIMWYSQLYEYVSADNGATWKKTLLYTKGGESKGNWMESVVARPSGQRERVILQWAKIFDAGVPPVYHTEVAVLDRPIGQITTTEIGAQAQISASSLGLNLSHKLEAKGITFRASTPWQGNFSIELYDLAGKKIWSSERVGSGVAELNWEPKDLKGGVYIAVLKQNRNKSVQRISFVR